MSLLTPHQVRLWLKTSDQPLAQNLFCALKALRAFEVPAPVWLFKPCFIFWSLATSTVATFVRVFWWTPLFKSRCENVGGRLYLYGGLPWICGPVKITIGDDCRISGKTTLTGRGASRAAPTLDIGNNVDLGWQCTVAVGSSIIIEDNVRIAGQCFLAGYPGHPVNADDRAMGLPELDSQAKDIVLKRDVWLGTGVSVLAGVTIGEGTIVGAGSVVTRDLPAGVLAGGNPAQTIRQLGS